MAESYLYEVKRGNEVLMQTSDPKCRYPAEVERFIMRSGCEIYINGKELALPKRSNTRGVPKTERRR